MAPSAAVVIEQGDILLADPASPENQHNLLRDSAVYNYYVPVILTFISIVYLSTYIYKSVHWYRIRRRKRRQRLDRYRVHQFWEKRMIALQINQSLLPPPTLTSFALPRSQSSPCKSFYTSDPVSCSTLGGLQRPHSTLETITSVISLPLNTTPCQVVTKSGSISLPIPSACSFDEKETTATELSPTFTAHTNYDNRSRRLGHNDRAQYRHIPKLFRKKEERQLELWKWSLSMGYCHYAHGKLLDDLIAELQKREQDVLTGSIAEMNSKNEMK
ncbi:hypothetical protein CLU79DRAFT_833521 [Phycomyces nitens]|nr:hypothetical protein CLU79DRAFT_833521 [Phycomyces nitens]